MTDNRKMILVIQSGTLIDGSTRDAALAGVDWIIHAYLATDKDLETVAAARICRRSSRMENRR